MVSLTGRTISVTGNATFDGQNGNLLNLNTGTVWNITVTGTLKATYATIGNSTATNNNGQATSTCVAGGGTTTGWTFDNENYAGSWSYSRPVYFNTTSTGANVTGNVTGFPMLLRMNSSNFPFAQSLITGNDIRFAKTNGTPLSYEIERWDSVNAIGEVWVTVDTVYGNNKTQSIKMYWGNISAPAKSSGVRTFDTGNGFCAAWHMKEASGKLSDASANLDSATQTGGITYGVSGVIAKAATLNGTSQYLTAVDTKFPNGSTSRTLSVWFKKTSSDMGTPGRAIVGWGNNTGAQRFVLWTSNSGGLAADINGYGYQFTWVYDTGWHHFAASFPGSSNALSTVNLYLDGVLKTGSPYGTSANVNTTRNQACIGATPLGNANFFDGTLDEPRVEKAARSADWIKLCYETQKIGSQAVNLSTAPVVTGLSGAGKVGASQTGLNTAVVTYEVDDPDGGNVTVSAQEKAASGSWTDMTNTSGDIGTVAVSPTTDRGITWTCRTQLGSSVEGTYYVRVIASDGTLQDTAASDSFMVDTRPPVGLASLAALAITGASVTLTWTAAVETNFNHYEIWYGTTQADVQNRNLTAHEWDNAIDAALATRTTAAATITGLTGNTPYYFKIWAIDNIGNESTIADISASTLNVIAPTWTRTSLGAINGGVIRQSSMYLGSGASAYALICINLSSGATRWSYSTATYGACGMPTYAYVGTNWKVVATAGNYLIGRQDDSTASTQLWAPLNLGATAGTPYISPDGASVYVPYTGNLTKRSMSDPASGPVTVAVGSISTSADIVVASDYVYCATTDGYVDQYDAADLTPLTQSTQISGGPSVTLPLIYSTGTLYVTPSNSTVQAFTTSTMGAAKWSMTYTTVGGASNSGPAFIIQARDTLYTAAGNYVVKIGDAGGSGTTKWTYDASGAVNSGPIFYGASVYFGRNGGSYYAIDDATGLIRTHWPYTSASGNATSGPWIDVTNSRVIFGTTGGNLDAFALEP